MTVPVESQIMFEYFLKIDYTNNKPKEILTCISVVEEIKQ